MKKTSTIISSLLITLMLVLASTVSADCESGDDGDNTLSCSTSTSDDLNGGGGNDNMSNNSNVGGDMIGDGALAGGNDLIINNGNVGNNIIGDGAFPGGNDTIINNGNVGNDIIGDSAVLGGNDSISNNGTVNGDIIGDSADYAGHDTITNNGTVNGTIYGDLAGGSGNDLIIINGTVNGDIIGDAAEYAGHDTVVLGDGAVVGGTIFADLAGTDGYDELHFAMTIDDHTEAERVAAALANAAPGGGTIVINGQTYQWDGFEELVDLINYAIAAARNSRAFISDCIADGRLNNCDMEAPAAVYCYGSGMRIMDIAINGDGTMAFEVTADQIDQAVAQALLGGTNILIAEGMGSGLYALSSNELQLNGVEKINVGKTYEYTFDPTTCG